MIRFGGQGDKRADKSAEGEEEGRQAGSEGRREGTAAAARRVYTHRCVVDRVFSLMSLAEAAELAHADTHTRTMGEGAQAQKHIHTHTSTYAKTHTRESDGMLVTQRHTF